MISPTSSIMRAAVRDPDGPFNILLFPHDISFHEILGKTPNTFYVLRHPTINWQFDKGKPPANHILLQPDPQVRKMPTICDIDLIISQSRLTDEFNTCYGISQFYHIPLLAIEFEPNSKGILDIVRGNVNAFRTEPIRTSWHIFDERNSMIMDSDKDTPVDWHNLFKKAAKVIFKGNNKL